MRELENVLERALALCDGNTITADDLLLDTDATANTAPLSQALEDENMPLPDYLEQLEKQAILNALEKTQNNKTAAAKLLGVSFRTFRYRFSKLGLSKDND